MNLIRKITDADFTDEEPEYLNTVSRYGSRGILFNENNEIAMMFMETKSCYKLPGGGIEEGETKEEGFLREILEETGYEAEIIKELGIIEEHKIKNNFLHISYGFIARAISKHEAKLSDHEKELGFKLVWMNIDDALNAMNESIKICDEYKMKFMLLRDKTLIEIAKG